MSVTIEDVSSTMLLGHTESGKITCAEIMLHNSRFSSTSDMAPANLEHGSHPLCMPEGYSSILTYKTLTKPEVSQLTNFKAEQNLFMPPQVSYQILTLSGKPLCMSVQL